MKYLALALMGNNRLDVLNDLVKYVTSCGCNIVECQANDMGKEWVATFFLSGTWNALAKLETNLPTFEKKHELKILSSRTELPEPEPEKLPYTVYVVAQDRPGILEEVLNFLIQEGVELKDYHGHTYLGRFTKANMITLTINVTIPAERLISEIRERFILFCDDLNLDATMEPDK